MINATEISITHTPSPMPTTIPVRKALPSSSITGSNWAPHLTAIGFYDTDKRLVMVARYPQPIKLEKDTNLTFKIRQDW